MSNPTCEICGSKVRSDVPAAVVLVVLDEVTADEVPYHYNCLKEAAVIARERYNNGQFFPAQHFSTDYPEFEYAVL